DQQHVGVGDNEAAKRHTTLFATGEVFHLRIPRRQTQCIGGDFEGAVDVPAIAGVDLALQYTLTLKQGVHFVVAHRLGELVADGVVLVDQILDFTHAIFDVFAHRALFVELGLLRQIADLEVWLRTRFTEEILVHASHDAQQGRLTRAVQAEYADLGAREKGERNVLQDFAFGRHDFADPVHGENELGHRSGNLSKWN